MNIKSIIENTIRRGDYNLAQTLNRIDTYYIEGILSDSDRNELYDLARQKPQMEIDPQEEIQKLWAALHELEARVDTYHPAETVEEQDAEMEEESDNKPSDGIDPWHEVTGAHDAYYNGNVMRFTDGKVYRCIAPVGFACSWSPVIMPSYWEEVV